MSKLWLAGGVVVLLTLVSGAAIAAPPPPDWLPQANIPVELTVDGYGKITVVNSSLNLEIWADAPAPPPWPDWPGDFVQLDVESNIPVVLDVVASNNGRLRAEEGGWFKYDPAKGTYVWYGVCGGWADSPEEFNVFMYDGTPIEGLGLGCWWNPDSNHLDWGPGPGPYQIPEGGVYPPGWDGEAWPVTVGGWAGLASEHGYVAPGIYRGELTITISPL